MPKLIYAEPDDEITNLVDRLRSEKDERDLVFVLPAASRVLQSGLNARLLMQYSNSLGKSTAIVSPDRRTQAMSVETGFKVFPSLARYEIGAPVTESEGAASDPAPNGSPVLATVPAAPVTPAPRRTQPAAPRAPVAPHTVARPLSPALVSEGVGGERWVPYVLGGVIGLVALLVAGLVWLPAAEVDVTVTARPVSATATVSGSTAGPSAEHPSAIQTKVINPQESSPQQQFTATGVKQIPAVASTGQVVFSNNTTLCATFPQGTEVYTDSGVKFKTQAASPQLCAGQSSPAVPVTAEQGGASSNVAAHAINHINAGQYQDLGLAVDNPSATGGGVDASQKTVVSQADLDNAKNTLAGPLVTKVQQELQQQAGSLHVVAESTGPPDVVPTYDHKVGDETQNFNASFVVKGHATLVDENAIRQALRNALQTQVPSGYVLTDDKLKQDWQLVQHDDGAGTVVYDGNVSGFMASAVNIDRLQHDLTGKSPQAAQNLIRDSIETPGDAIIVLRPPFMPWLPWIASHITVKRLVQNTTP